MLFEPSIFSTIDATLPLLDFHARPLPDDVVQVAYISNVDYDGKIFCANRSSIWSRTSEGWGCGFTRAHRYENYLDRLN